MSAKVNDNTSRRIYIRTLKSENNRERARYRRKSIIRGENQILQTKLSAQNTDSWFLCRAVYTTFSYLDNLLRMRNTHTQPIFRRRRRR